MEDLGVSVYSDDGERHKIEYGGVATHTGDASRHRNNQKTMDNPLLSICIPTYNRPELLVNTVKNIIHQDVDAGLYEICISDDSDDDRTEEQIRSILQNNIKYVHKKAIKPAENFRNVLSMATGKLVKMLNDYSMIKDGALKLLIRAAEKYDEDTALFFMEPEKRKRGLYRHNSFDGFAADLSIFATYSAYFTIWNKDLKKFIESGTVFHEYFPQVQMLYSLIGKREYIVVRQPIYDMQKLEKKGGYNLPDVFGNQFIQLVRDSYDMGHVSKNTFHAVQKEALKFVARWYGTVKNHSDTFYFDFSDDACHLRKQFAPQQLAYYYAYSRAYRIAGTLWHKILRGFIRRGE